MERLILALIPLVLLLSNQRSTAQLHRITCVNSDNTMDPSKEDSATYGPCFRVDANPMPQAGSTHISVHQMVSKAGCAMTTLQVKRIEIMGRGNVNYSVKRYAIGEFGDRTAGSLCPEHDTTTYHVDIDPSDATLTHYTCSPLVNRGLARLLYENKAPKIAVMEWKNLSSLIKLQGDVILACDQWHYMAPKNYPRLSMDWTAEIIFRDVRRNVDAFVQVGQKYFKQQLLSRNFPASALCNLPTNTGNRTTNSNETFDRLKLPTTTTTLTTTTTTTPTTATLMNTTTPKPQPVTRPVDVITIASTKPTSGPDVTPKPEEGVSGRKEIHDGCLFIKGCVADTVGDSADCLERNTCLMVVSYGKGQNESPEDDETVVELYGTGHAWIAIGISEDKTMGDDLVIECVVEGLETNMYLSWNRVKNRQNVICNLGPQGRECRDNIRLTGDNSHDGVVRLIKSSNLGGTIYCKFYLKKQFKRKRPWDNFEPKEFSFVTTSYYVLMATGDNLRKVGKNGNIDTHRPERRFISPNKINLGKRLSPYAYQTEYFKIHGIFMVIAWLFFIPTGSFVARYMKNTFTGTVIRGQVLWKFIHTVFLWSAFIFNAVGVTFYIMGKYGWSSEGRSSFHAYGGVSLIASLAILTFTGICVHERPFGEPKHPGSVVHGVGGHIIFIFSCAIFILAPRVSFSNLPCSFQLTVISWIISYFVLHVVMSYHYCWVKYIENVAPNAVINETIYRGRRSQFFNHNPTTEVDESKTTTDLRKVTPSTSTDTDIQHGLEMRRLTSQATEDEYGSDSTAAARDRTSIDIHRNLVVDDVPERFEAPDSYHVMVGIIIFALVNLIHVASIIIRMEFGKACYGLSDYIKFYKDSQV